MVPSWTSCIYRLTTCDPAQHWSQNRSAKELLKFTIWRTPIFQLQVGGKECRSRGLIHCGDQMELPLVRLKGPLVVPSWTSCIYRFITCDPAQHRSQNRSARELLKFTVWRTPIFQLQVGGKECQSRGLIHCGDQMKLPLARLKGPLLCCNSS